MSSGTDCSPVDVAVIGGGHNALVGATLLARSGFSVTLFERSARLGGATVSTRPFAGVDVRVSPYAYLVSLFPRALMDVLGIDLELRRRRPASCTPDGGGALVTDPLDTEVTRRSFEAMGLGEDHGRWVEWQQLVDSIARVVAPTLMEPLRPAPYFRSSLGEEAWELVAVRPLGASLDDRFVSDVVRGTVLTDGLIGTFAQPGEASLRQNRCWLYHVVGDGTGEWKVPVGGMGALTDQLERAALAAGVEIRTGTEVVSLDADGAAAELVTAGGATQPATVVLCGAAPPVLDRLLGSASGDGGAEGAQVKINMVVRRLPRLRCGLDPQVAFAGTLHVNERGSQLEAAWSASRSGMLPSPVPCEVYCHSLTDPSVIGPALRAEGVHTLSLFALQTPSRLFDEGPIGPDEALEACLSSFSDVLAEPLSDCLFSAADGQACVEVHTPGQLEEELGLPGGNIFHGELRWPWAEEDVEVGRWGVETALGNVFMCGSGARRGGAVSGLGGHNAAMAALELFRRRR